MLDDSYNSQMDQTASVNQKTAIFSQLSKDTAYLSEKIGTANLGDLTFVLDICHKLDRIQNEGKDVESLLDVTAIANPHRSSRITIEKSLINVQREATLTKRLLRQTTRKWVNGERVDDLQADLQIMMHSLSLALYELYKHLGRHTEPLLFYSWSPNSSKSD